MNSGLLNYQLPTLTGIMHHDQSSTTLVRDGDSSHQVTLGRSRSAVDVQVHSGDYFVTLATILDEMSCDIETYAVRMELENIVSDLIYLQDNYTITKNKPVKKSL